jgi:hypothetical protein
VVALRQTNAKRHPKRVTLLALAVLMILLSASAAWLLTHAVVFTISGYTLKGWAAELRDDKVLWPSNGLNRTRYNRTDTLYAFRVFRWGYLVQVEKARGTVDL